MELCQNVLKIQINYAVFYQLCLWPPEASSQPRPFLSKSCLLSLLVQHNILTFVTLLYSVLNTKMMGLWFLGNALFNFVQSCIALPIHFTCGMVTEQNKLSSILLETKCFMNLSAFLLAFRLFKGRLFFKYSHHNSTKVEYIHLYTFILSIVMTIMSSLQ